MVEHGTAAWDRHLELMRIQDFWVFFFNYSMHENRRWERWKPYILLKWYLMVFVAVNLLIQVLPWTTIVWHGHLGSDLMACFLRHRIACSSVHMASFFTTLVPRIRIKEVVKLMETPGNSCKKIYCFFVIFMFPCFIALCLFFVLWASLLNFTPYL